MSVVAVIVLILCIILMLAGLAGTVVPVLPGIPVIWAAMLIYGWFTDWAYYGFASMLIIGLLVVMSVVVDQLASVMGAKKFGATKAGMIGSVVGAILGLIIFSLPGLILGTFLGAMILELTISKRNFRESMVSGTGALLGFLAGSLFKFMLGVSFIFYFIGALIFG